MQMSKSVWGQLTDVSFVFLIDFVHLFLYLTDLHIWFSVVYSTLSQILMIGHQGYVI